MRRIELADHVVEIREAPLAQLEQLLEESIGPRHFLERHRFPQRHRLLAPGRHDAVPLRAQPAGGDHERRRVALVDALEQQRVIREERERRIVERREAEAEERRGAIGEDRADELARRDRAMEDRGAPEIRRQRHRHEVARSRVRRPPARRLLTRRRQVRVGRRLPAVRGVVEQACDFVDEAAAVRHRIDSQRTRERDGATGDRHVLGHSGCGG